jgi:hypothetical protein
MPAASVVSFSGNLLGGIDTAQGVVWNRNLIVKPARAARVQHLDDLSATAGAARHGTEPVAAGTDTPPPELGTRRLDRVLRIVNAGPRPFYLAAIVSLAVTSVLALAISSLVRPAGRLPGSQREMIYGSLAVLCLCAVLGIASLALRGRSWDAAWLDRIVGPRVRAAFWLALAVWVPFLLLVVYYRARATFPVTIQWLYYGFEDKRWKVAAYLLTALAPMLLLTAAARALEVGRGYPPTWRAWLAGLFGRDGAADLEGAAPAGTAPAGTAWEGAAWEGTAWAGAPWEGTADAAKAEDEPVRWRQSRTGRIVAVAAGLATAVVLGWYFFGPPWYLSQSTAVVTPQEDFWFSGFQAISHGYVPYTGAAVIQYGPGTQLFTYLLMRHVTSFSILGFRQAWAIYQWVGASILFAVFFLAYGYLRGLAISLLGMLVYPALQEVAFHPGGSFTGYFGWANPLRYAGMIALVALLPAVVRRCPSRWGVAAAAALGVLWGFTSYLAQEDLIAGVVGTLLVGALLLFSRTASWRAVRAALVAVLAGFLLIWVPVLAFYGIHGDLGPFLKLYFLLARAMPQGFGNTPWQGGTLTTMYYALPFLLAAAAFLTVFELRPLRIAAVWSPERLRLAVTVIITVMLYQGVLLRSDATDMTGTLLMVPALVIMTATVLPRSLGVRRPVTVTIAGAVLIAASFALLPQHSFQWTSVRAQAQAPYLDRQRLAADPSPAAPTTLAAQRIGAGLAGAPQCCQGPALSMASIARDMQYIHTVIGNRTTYVSDFPHGYPGFVYFVADLTPAPTMEDKYGTILNQPQLNAYMAYFRTNVLPHTQALVTGDLTRPEAQSFLQRYPHARRILMHIGAKPYYILLAQG